MKNKFCVKSKHGLFEQNTYIVESEAGCVLIDAGVPPNDIRMLTNKQILAVFITHSHFDHIYYIEDYDKENIPIYASIYASENMLNERLNVSIMEKPKKYKLSHINNICDGDEVKIADIKVKCISSPGHTLDGMSYLIGDMLFSGDTLFADSIGRTDFSNSNENDMLKSLIKLNNLEYNTLFSGHGRVSNKQEQNQNIPQWISYLKK